MAWVRLDDEFYLHPKVVAAGPLGLALQVAALCYSNHYLTDGFIPKQVVKRLLDYETLAAGNNDVSWQMVAGLLLDAGLWDECDGGYSIHDFAQYQPTRETALKERAQKVAAGQAGGKASAQARAKRVLQAESEHPSQQITVAASDSPTLPEAPASKPSTHSSRTQARAQAKSKPVPVPVPVPISSDPSDRAPPAPADCRIAFFQGRKPNAWVAAVIDMWGVPLSKEQREHLGGLLKRRRHGQKVWDAAEASKGAADPVQFMERILSDGKRERPTGDTGRTEKEPRASPFEGLGRTQTSGGETEGEGAGGGSQIR